MPEIKQKQKDKNKDKNKNKNHKQTTILIEHST